VKIADSRIEAVKQWHQDLQWTSDLSDKQYATFIHYAMEFFPDSDWLWRKDPQGAHKLVVKPDRRLYILRHVHDNIGISNSMLLMQPYSSDSGGHTCKTI
jgi:hypothetical protein